MLQFMDHNQDRDMEGVEEQVKISARVQINNGSSDHEQIKLSM